MDIIALSGPDRSKQRRPRRHTTEVRIEHLPSWNEQVMSKDKNALDTSSHSMHLNVEESLSQGNNDPLMPVEGNLLPIVGRTASWHSLEGGSDDDTSSNSDYFQGSQVDVLQEMKVHPLSSHLMAPKHGYQLSYELALDNVLSPFSSPGSPPYGMTPTTYNGHVILEMVTTEKTYVGDLTDIVEGYILPLDGRIQYLELTTTDLESLFGNVKSIRDFNRSVLHTLKKCRGSCKMIGQCFREKAEGFKTHYSKYCNNYPNSIQVLSRLSQDSSISRFLKICQQRLNHMLPLGAYLLKPVQRVLKYSLLLEQLVKNMTVEEEGFAEVSSALEKMTSVSKHINEMKKRYDAAIHIQELQSLLRGAEDINLSQCGDLVLEQNFRYGGRASGPIIRGRADRFLYVFLFKKLMLMVKKEDDGYQYKEHFQMKDIQLTERVEKDPNSFQIRKVSNGRFFTLQAPSVKTKEKWVKNIKVLLMESIPGLPDKAKKLIMAGFPTDFGELVKHSPKPSHSSRQKLDTSRHTMTSTNLFQQTKAKQKQRSSTLPNILAEKLVQASLLATLQLEPTIEEPLLEGETYKSYKKKDRQIGRKEKKSVGGKSLTENDMEPIWEQDNEMEMQSTDLVVENKEEDVIRENETHEILIGQENSVCEGENVEDDNEAQTNVFPKLIVTVPSIQASVFSNNESLTSNAENPKSTPQDSHANLHHVGGDNHGEKVEAIEHNSIVIPQARQVNMSAVDINIHSVPEEDNTIRLTPIDDTESKKVPRSDSAIAQGSQKSTVEDANDDNVFLLSPNIIDPPLMFQSKEHRNHSSSFTEDDESLFDDLMSKNPNGGFVTYFGDGTTNTVYNAIPDNIYGDTKTSLGSTEHLEHQLQSVDCEEYITAKAASQLVRPWKVSKPLSSLDLGHITAQASSVTNVMNSGHSIKENDMFQCDHLYPVIDPPPQYLEKDFGTTYHSRQVFRSPQMTRSKLCTQDTGEKRHSVVRRHSYKSQHQHRIMHQRDGSRSSGNSPEKSPVENKKTAKGSGYIKVKRRTNFSKGAISVVGLVSTSRTDLNLEDSCLPVTESNIIVPPPEEFMTNEKEISKLRREALSQISSHQDQEFRSLVPQSPKPITLTSSTMNPTNPVSLKSHYESHTANSENLGVPYHGNPDERLSFDEMLQSYDHYASATGNTTKTKSKEVKKRSSSPELSRKQKKKKNRKRSMTVGNIDSSTIQAAKEAMRHTDISSEVPKERRRSKVQGLAREYSRKIKETQRSNWFKRFSTVTEDDESSMSESGEPDWLQKLREKHNKDSSQQRTDSTIPKIVEPITTGSTLKYTAGKRKTNEEAKLKSSSLKYQPTEKSSTTLLKQYADVSSSPLYRSQSTDFELDRVNTPDSLELEKTGGIKGWVKNLVLRFSGNR